MVKMTFTLDDETVAALEQTAARLSKPRSAIVREAIRDYGARAGRLGEDERRRMLRALDDYSGQPAHRARAAVDGEIRNVRLARRAGGHRTR